MAYFSETQLPRYREEDLPGTVKRLYNFCRELQEMLQFVMSNLDADNIEGYEEIFNRLKDGEGNVSILKQTSNEILLQVQQNGEKIGTLEVKAEEISATVMDPEKGIAKLNIRADEISGAVADNAGNITTLTERANGLDIRISNAEGDVTSLSATAKKIAAIIAGKDGDITQIEATANGLSSRVSSAESAISTVRQTADGLSTRVSSAEASISSVEITAESIRQAVYGKNGSGASTSVSAEGLIYEVFNADGKFSRLAQTVDGIDISGAVTFNDLEEAGQSVINGGNITTGNIDLESVTLSNNSGELTIGSGSTNKTNTRGAVLYGPSTAVYLIVTEAGCRMTAVTTHFYVGAGVVEFSIAIKEGSDERIKNTITYDVADRYGAFYRALKPARFHRSDGTSGRFHTGFIAQQLRDALTDGGLTSQDLAALVQTDYNPNEKDGGGGQYGIRYTELIPLNTAMIQQLMARVDALEAEVESLKGGA